jgi:hypothetical protein
MNLITSLDAITYHFVSKTSRFSEEYQTRTRQIEIQSNRNYIRKWGSRGSTKKYDVGFILTNCGIQHLETLEPWCDRIYTDEVYKVGRLQDYIENEQKNTRYDLRSKFTFTDNVDVMIYETAPFDDMDIRTLHKLRLSIPYYEVGEYQIGNMMIDSASAVKYWYFIRLMGRDPSHMVIIFSNINFIFILALLRF